MRIAIFGGTFDPVHNAHLTIARAAADRFRLDRVLFVTAAQPPHKTDRQTEAYEHRHRMVEIACEGDDRFQPSRLEAGFQKSYSIQTITRVQRTLTDTDELFFVIGADAFADLQTWHRWHDVIASVEFIVISRPGHIYAVPEGARVHRLDDLKLPTSSSEIRRQLRQKEIPGELPPRVFAYIREHGLYGVAGARYHFDAQI